VSVSSNPLHIMHSSSSLTKLSCGTKSRPWMLEAPAGQQISVSLLDFGVNTRETQLEKNCLQYGYIVDKSVNKNVSICALSDERKNTIYKSASNQISIVVVASFRADVNEEYKVLIGITAVGCSNALPPDDMWLRRNENEAVVGCYTSHQTWHLLCVDNKWTGVIGNCTREISQEPVLSKVSPEPRDRNQVLLIVAIVSVGLIICVVIIICGVLCLKRYRAMNDKTKYSYPVNSSTKYKQASLCQQPMNGFHSTEQPQ